MKKNKKIIIAIIIVAILILVVGVALAFVLKNNNKEEFFKYAAQIFDNESGLIDNRLEQYNKKKENETFDNKGKITVNVPTDDLDSKTANSINNEFSISFMGNVDNPNEKVEELIKINYNNNYNFPILYKKIGNLQAFKLTRIMQKYLGSKNFNILSALGFGQDEKVLESNMKLSEDEIKQLIEKNINDIKDIIDEKSISKVSNAESEGYSLELSYEKLKEIINLVIDNIKQDEKLLEKLNLNSNKLDTFSLYCNNLIPTEGKIIITIYQNNKKINRVNLILDDTLKLDVKKVNQDNELSYDINFTYSQNNYDILAKALIEYSGLDSLEKVNENYNLGIEVNGNSYTYNIENTVNFTDVEINDFEENEYVDVQKYTSEKLSKLLQTIWDRTISININLMEQAKINPENFWQSFIPKSNISSTNEDTLNSFFAEEDEEKKEELEDDKNSNTTNSNSSSTTSNTNSSTSDDLATSFSEVEKKNFNSKYTAYAGDSVNGSDLKKLFMQIIANNMADEERPIKVSGDIALTGNEVPSGIDGTKTYTVSFKKSNDGYINEAIIKENE